MILFTADGVLRRPFRYLSGLAGYLFAVLVGVASAAASVRANDT